MNDNLDDYLDGTTVDSTKKDELEGIEITAEFEKAFADVEYNDKNLFITGDAGSGKSTFLKYLKKNTSKNFAVLAPTGVAAINVGGQTVHSFFKLSPKAIYPEQVSLPSEIDLYLNLDMLIIDEISMVRADMFDIIDVFLRTCRENDEPFGGVQMITVGDLNQLPPVVFGDADKAVMEEYLSPFFFDSKVYTKGGFSQIRFTKIFRQTDPEFIEVLNSLKNGSVSYAELDKLNVNIVNHNLKEQGRIYLCSTNKIANGINEKRLNELSTPNKFFHAEITGKAQCRGTLIVEELHLKVGAQVMFINNDPIGRWANGTAGIVENIESNRLTISIEVNGKSMTVEVGKHEWENINYEVDKAKRNIEDKLVGTITQFPVKLAWAVTIHKSQGQSYDKVYIDLGFGTFAHGQLYVAISRCRTLEGIQLAKVIRMSDVKYDQRVMQFMGL